ncbi:MAG: protein CoxF [Filomicrobium sp.]
MSERMNVMERVSEEQAEAERRKRQRLRSIAIAIGLGVLVVLFYAATIVHLGGNALNRPF